MRRPLTPGRLAVPLLLVVGLVLGLWLVLDDGSDDDASGGGDSGAQDEATAPEVTLALEGDTSGDVAELADLALPASTGDFLSARLDDGSQLDVTFTLAPADEVAFLEGSALPAPVEGERVITHTSPLWDLNPTGTIRGTRDRTAEVSRTVELVGEGERTRVRLVITPAT